MSETPRMKALLDMMGQLENPPTDEVLTVALALRQFLSPYSDSGSVDSGHGFGESCLDFWMDGKAVRVIIKPVPDLDRDAPH